MDKKLTDADYCDAAEELGCEVAAIKAVAEVESAGGGFLKNGNIVIRFEGHVFRRETRRKYDKSHPHLSYPFSAHKSKSHGYTAFNEAFSLDPDSALLSTSWGKFQPMGFTHEEAGFDSVHDFVDYLKRGEREQLLAFVGLVRYRGLDDELRRHDWAGFARVYNGAAYKTNNYDVKMKRAYDKFKVQKIDCEAARAEIDNAGEAAVDSETQNAKASNSIAGTETTQTETLETDTGEVETEVTRKNEQSVHGTVKVSTGERYNDVGFIDTIKSDLAKLGIGNGILQTFSEWAEKAGQLPEYLQGMVTRLAWMTLIGSIVYLVGRALHYGFFTWRQQKRVETKALIDSDIRRKDVVWVEETQNVGRDKKITG